MPRKEEHTVSTSWSCADVKPLYAFETGDYHADISRSEKLNMLFSGDMKKCVSAAALI